MLKKSKPTSPGRRQLVLPLNETLTRQKRINFSKVDGKDTQVERQVRQTVEPEKSLLAPKRRTNGRNNMGHITCRHKGGGHKRQYRIVDFKRDKYDIPAKVASIEYDPNRSSYIALLNYVDGEKRYIIAPQGLKEGDTVQTSHNPPFNVGCAMPFKYMPIGSTVHNVEMVPGRGGVLVRSAGLSAQFMARSGGYATIRMPSGEMRMVSEKCMATFGVVSNPEHNLRSEGKAGRNRWKGIRPTVRGNAMNPVDHPHGGGEGRSKGNIPQSPWAVFAKGLKTRSLKKSSKFIVKDRKKK